MKFTDIVSRADKANPNAVLDIELDGVEHTLILRNMMRLTEEESKDVSAALAIMGLEGDELIEALTEEEREATTHGVLANRMAAALRATADDKKLWDEFVSPLREKHDFKTWMLELFAGYAQETRLGEAESSGK